jgi:hypothetical protein
MTPTIGPNSEKTMRFRGHFPGSQDWRGRENEARDSARIVVLRGALWGDHGKRACLGDPRRYRRGCPGSGAQGAFQLSARGWRNAHLLPPARQLPDAYHGSRVEYPPGTARQATRLLELLRDNETFKYVGWELWWEGFDVGEEYWKPKLQGAAATGTWELGSSNLFSLVAERRRRRG